MAYEIPVPEQDSLKIKKFTQATDHTEKVYDGNLRSRIFQDMPEPLENELYGVLSRSGLFSSDEHLRSLFIMDTISDLEPRLPYADSQDNRVAKTLKFLNDEGKLEEFLSVVDRYYPADDYDSVVLKRVVKGLHNPENFVIVEEPNLARNLEVDFGDGVTAKSIRERGLTPEVIHGLEKYKMFWDKEEWGKFTTSNKDLEPFMRRVNYGSSAYDKMNYLIHGLWNRRHKTKGSVLELFLNELKEKGVLDEEETGDTNN